MSPFFENVIEREWKYNRRLPPLHHAPLKGQVSPAQYQSSLRPPFKKAFVR